MTQQSEALLREAAELLSQEHHPILPYEKKELIAKIEMHLSAQQSPPKALSLQEEAEDQQQKRKHLRDLRDEVITGHYEISGGEKQPTDWKIYALNLEQHIISKGSMVVAELYVQQPRAQEPEIKVLSQEEQLDLLDKYFRETSKEEQQQLIDKVTAFGFNGIMVKEYFTSLGGSMPAFDKALSWEEACDKIAEEAGFVNWDSLTLEYVQRMNKHCESGLGGFQIKELEAAHLFMLSNREPKWIRVQDELPIMFEKVLIMGNKGSYGISSVDSSGKIDDYCLVDESEYAVRWMPLPEFKQ